MSDTAKIPIPTPRTDAKDKELNDSGALYSLAYNEIRQHAQILERELATMTAQRDALREAGRAFHLYVTHGPRCACLGRIPGEAKCTCGLDESLAAWSKAKTK